MKKKATFSKTRKASREIGKTQIGAKVTHEGYLKKMSSGVIKRW